MKRFVFLFILLLSACDEVPQAPSESTEKPPPQMILEQSRFKDLPEWGNDDLLSFTTAFLKSCVQIEKRPPEQNFTPLEHAGTYGDWQKICNDFKIINTEDQITLQSFIEMHFTPYQVRLGDDPIGLFTGYYESSLNGSRQKKPPFTTPLHIRPDDLIMVDLGLFRDELKGQRIAGRVKGGNLTPYETREDIVNGNWPHHDNDHVLIWVDDPVDAFFVQIQGSGIVTLDDGSSMRIGYAGQNGHPYYAIGRELIQRGILTKESVSMQSIRAWLENNPDQANELMNTNKSYVFFRELNDDGPVGAQNVVLTPGRSLAVDRTKISYGIPLWVDIEKPTQNAKDIRRLMIAQDTGGAITGAVRGDVFWGYGVIAEEMAGQMKSKGRYWALLPKQETIETDVNQASTPH